MRKSPFTDPEAAAFKDNFEPRDGVNYDWVIAYAKDLYEGGLATYRRLDDKAGSVVNMITAGSAGAVLAAAYGVSAGQVNPWVAVAILPAMCVAAVSLWRAIAARKTFDVPTPPGTVTAVKYAEYFPDGKSEAAFIGVWHLCARLMDQVVAKKAEAVDRALGWFYAALFLLVVPLMVAIGMRLSA